MDMLAFRKAVVRESLRELGHEISNFSRYGSDKSTAFAVCRKCMRTVMVNLGDVTKGQAFASGDLVGAQCGQAPNAVAQVPVTVVQEPFVRTPGVEAAPPAKAKPVTPEPSMVDFPNMEAYKSAKERWDKGNTIDAVPVEVSTPLSEVSEDAVGPFTRENYVEPPKVKWLEGETTEEHMVRVEEWGQRTEALLVKHGWKNTEGEWIE